MMHKVTPARRVSVYLSVAALFVSPFAAASSAAVRSLLEIRQENVVVQQWDMSCGAAALATLLTYQLGDPIAERQVAQGMLRSTDPMRVRHRGGFSLLDMKKYARSRGFKADGYAQLTLENLRKFAPLIVPVQLEGYDHFVVFRGVAAGHAVLADPGFGNRKLTVAQFEKVWNGGIGFVVGSRDDSNSANRMPPRKADLLAVEEEVVRAALDSDLPAPLNDWQMTDLPWLDNPSLAGDSDEADPVNQLSDGEADSIVAAGPNPITQTLSNLPVGSAPAATTLSSGIQTTISVPATVSAPVNTAVSSVTQTVSAVASTTSSIISAASAPVSTVVKPVTTTVNSVTAAAAPIVDTVSAPVATAVKTATQTVSSIASSTAPVVAAASTTITAVVKPVTQALSTVTPITTSAVAAIATPVSTAVKPVTTTVNSVVAAAAPVIATASAPVSTVAKSVTQTVSSTASTAAIAPVKIIPNTVIRGLKIGH